MKKHVDNTCFNSISLFSGVAMLDEGCRAGLEYLGQSCRTIAHVEREAYACSQLIALMEAECLDAAPVWSDVTTFPSKEFSGLVDIITAGFPCQDFSLAGKRAGLDGKRSRLFFEILRIANDCGARWLFLENVAAIATATASALDEDGNHIYERAAARVMGELADDGWVAEWTNLRAANVGAPHQRNRWFCLAYRARERCREARAHINGRKKRSAIGGNTLGHNNCKRVENCSRNQSSSGTFFPPGRDVSKWKGENAPPAYLQPAIEPGVYGVVNGLALVVDASRNHQIRAAGNGVVALQAAAAFVELFQKLIVKK
jgi:DNA (cytosine-5)-methyltransferase 1